MGIKNNQRPSKQKIKINIITVFTVSLIKNHRQERFLFKQRILKISVIVAILGGILIARLFYLQIYQYKLYTKLSAHNQFTLLPLEPNRGLIYDRNGVLLAENIPVFNLSIIPDHTPSIATTIANLQKIINLSPDNINQFYKFLDQHRRSDHIPLKLKLSKEEIANFYTNQFRFAGVTIDASMIRHYPLGETTTSVTGYVGRINTQDLKQIDSQNYSASHFIGKTGIEKNYENQLHGKIGYQEAETDAFGHILRIIKQVSPIPGDNLYLTVDSKLQQVAATALGNENGAIVAVDPTNGEILALVSRPSFDPNLFSGGIDNKTFQALRHSVDKPMFNRAIKGQFPLASTIKPFIALAGLDTNTIDKNFTIADPGWFKLPNSEHIYLDWQRGHGTVNITKAIIVSCDTFFYTLAVKLGIEKIDAIMARFGFGQKTGIDLAEEQTGVVASPNWKMAHTRKPWYPGDTVISGIGQGFMTATPLQLAMGAAAIAKHGQRFQPHVLLQSVPANNLVVVQPSIALTPVVLNEPTHWVTVINAMTQVISAKLGTARARFGENYPYTIAGKTGTAQLYQHKIDENGNVIAMNVPKRLRNHSLFIAFAPVESPKLAIAVIAENVNTAPAIARKVIDQYLLKKF